MLTLVAAVEDARESIGAFEVEKGGDREDQEQADQQCSQKKRGCHTWPSCSQTVTQNRKQQKINVVNFSPAAADIYSIINSWKGIVLEIIHQ